MSINSIKTSFKIGPSDQEYNTVMVLTPECAAVFRPMYEIEILQGEENHKEDGLIEFKFNLSKEKVNILKRAISNNFFGNPNDRMQ